MLNNQKNIHDEIQDTGEIKEQSEIAQSFVHALFDELFIPLVLLGICFLFGNVYFAYVVFGVGALFLILPFSMLIYYAAKKYVQKQKVHDKNHELSEK